jgi:hypothetical protein
MMRLIAVFVATMPGLEPGHGFAQTAAKPPETLTLYKNANSAACSNDATVWVDPQTRLYYVKGDRMFGKTARGGYNCSRQAEAAGYQANKPR